MTKKRFKSNCRLGLVNGEEPQCKCLLDNGKHKSYREWVDLLNNFSDENEQLKKENNKLIVDYNGLNCEYHWLKEEKEQLEQRMKEYEE